MLVIKAFQSSGNILTRGGEGGAGHRAGQRAGWGQGTGQEGVRAEASALGRRSEGGAGLARADGRTQKAG